MPSRTMTPIAPATAGQARRIRPAEQVERHDAVDAEAGGQGDRDVPDQAHRDGQDAGDERRRRRGGGHRDAGRGQDAGVHEDDVGHDHEGGQAGLRLGRQRRAALGELEVLRDRASAPTVRGGSILDVVHLVPSLLPSTARRAPGAGTVRATGRALGRPRGRPRPLSAGASPHRRPGSAIRPRGLRGRAAPSGRSRTCRTRADAARTARRPRSRHRSARTRR